ncbi:TIGR03752 family integrating conjugative element protein [Salmonella enterica subsp. enterica serovar Uganda]|uniref:TIGR03752 family integrating conjugative element protein n=1 Tax=Citrobacter koseri TaxID=545 RepID=UPI0010787E56|nr:TIGR03752 family integrating conjugative element protein [Citrobacter koseri]EAB3870714.1 TIGR03752 family integrating conjugative element protein [Salmonella enterica]EAC1542125.1 TIGR03752 family integrating conjugative element protein [Salmonella enterica subsp. enterica]EBO2751080.1 TIGR03752 family integrating conjugative element protein [Salmonella enterica subsp. enterica serovar Agona]EDE1788973.1 TIGR03752 family integrating conjugative element protein [Salmonella enterica subsp. en
MTKATSNILVRVVVPVVVVVAILITVKSCSSGDNAPEQAQGQGTTSTVLKDLTPEELKALGVEGDTAQDTLRTIAGNFRTVRERLDSLDGENKRLREENKQLRQAGSNVDGQISQAVNTVRNEEEQKRSQLTARLTDLDAQLARMMEQMQGNGGTAKSGNAGQPAGGSGSDIPIGFGYDDSHNAGSGTAQPGADGMLWVEPRDGIATDANGRPVSGGNTNNVTGFSFATSFGEATGDTKAAATAVVQKASEAVDESVEPVYTLPENSTLIGSRAMTALLGRVPIDGKVTDPYPFKVLIGKDNLTANGIELPDVQGAIISGTATGDWTLSCVRGSLTSVTFVFTDGTIRTLSSVGGQQRSQGNGESAGQGGQGSQNGNGSIGWISDENGIPCISGDRKSNASTYLPTIGLLAAASAGGDALTENQNTSQTNGYGGVTSTLTGDAGQAVLGKALSGGMKETVDWVKARYGQTFDAIYVPPGQKLAVHITRQLAIDYEEKGRRVKYDFSLAGNGTGMD